MSQIVVLPYPPSANRYWRNVNGRTLVSREAKAYKEEAGWIAKVDGVEPVKGDVVVKIAVHRPQRRGDLDNTLKVLLDALNGIAWQDDNQIVRIEAERHDDPDNPRAVVEIMPAGR